MVKTIIIDDEPDARFLLKHALAEHYVKDLVVTAEADNVKQAKKLLVDQQPDLVFLDIQMNDGTGFDLLEQLPECNFEIVFVTAYDQFALKAFDFYALGYLVKPFKKSKLYQTVDNFLAKKDKAFNPGLKILSGSYANQQISKIVIPHLDGFNVIDLDAIIYLKSDNNYSDFYLQNGDKLTSSRTLKEYERMLLEKGFFRIHQQFLVNLKFVLSYSKVGGGQVEMKNGNVLPIGRRRVTEFRKLFL